MAANLEKAATDVISGMSSDDQAAAFDPSSILAIMEIIAQLLEQCRARRTPAQLVEATKSPGLLERLSVRRTVRANLSANEWRSHGPRLVESLIAKGATATLEEMEAVLDEVETL